MSYSIYHDRFNIEALSARDGHSFLVSNLNNRRYEQMHIINDTLMELPDNNLQSLYYYLLGFTTREIAKKVGRSRQTISNEIHRAVNHVRENWFDVD